MSCECHFLNEGKLLRSGDVVWCGVCITFNVYLLSVLTPHRITPRQPGTFPSVVSSFNVAVSRTHRSSYSTALARTHCSSQTLRFEAQSTNALTKTNLRTVTITLCCYRDIATSLAG